MFSAFKIYIIKIVTALVCLQGSISFAQENTRLFAGQNNELRNYLNLIGDETFVETAKKNFFRPTVKAYLNICRLDTPTETEFTTLLNNIENICEVVTAGSICSEVKDGARLRCDRLEENHELLFSSVFGCLAGGWDALVDVAGFVFQVLKWLFNPLDTLSAGSEYMESIKSYLLLEWEKAKSETTTWEYFHGKAAFKFFRSISALIGRSIDEFISREIQEIGCLNRKARAGLVCEVVGNIFLPGRTAEGMITVLRAGAVTGSRMAKSAVLRAAQPSVNSFLASRTVNRGRNFLGSVQESFNNLAEIKTGVQQGVEQGRKVVDAAGDMAERVRHPLRRRNRDLRQGRGDAVIAASDNTAPSVPQQGNTVSTTPTPKAPKPTPVVQTSTTYRSMPSSGETIPRISTSQTTQRMNPRLVEERTAGSSVPAERTRINETTTNRTSVPRPLPSSRGVTESGRTGGSVRSREALQEQYARTRNAVQEQYSRARGAVRERANDVAANPRRYLDRVSATAHGSRALVGRVQSREVLDGEIILETRARERQTPQFNPHSPQESKAPVLTNREPPTDEIITETRTAERQTPQFNPHSPQESKAPVLTNRETPADETITATRIAERETLDFNPAFPQERNLPVLTNRKTPADETITATRIAERETLDFNPAFPQERNLPVLTNRETPADEIITETRTAERQIPQFNPDSPQESKAPVLTNRKTPADETITATRIAERETLDFNPAFPQERNLPVLTNRETPADEIITETRTVKRQIPQFNPDSPQERNTPTQALTNLSSAQSRPLPSLPFINNTVRIPQRRPLPIPSFTNNTIQTSTIGNKTVKYVSPFFDSGIKWRRRLHPHNFFHGHEAVFLLPQANYTFEQTPSLFTGRPIGRFPLSLGYGPKQKSEGWMEKIKNLFGFGKVDETDKNILRVGKHVSFRNWENMGGISNGIVQEDMGEIVKIIFREPGRNGAARDILVEKDKLYKPMNITFGHMKVGDRISFPQSFWRRSNGIVTSIRDNMVRVSVLDAKQQVQHTWIPTEKIGEVQ